MLCADTSLTCLSCSTQQSDDECVLDLDLITDLVLQIDAHGEPGWSCLTSSSFLLLGGEKGNPSRDTMMLSLMQGLLEFLLIQVVSSYVAQANSESLAKTELDSSVSWAAVRGFVCAPALAALCCTIAFCVGAPFLSNTLAWRVMFLGRRQDSRVTSKRDLSVSKLLAIHCQTPGSLVAFCPGNLCL